MLKEHAELIYVSVCVSGANGKLTDVLTLLIQYLDNPDCDPTVSLCVFLFTDVRSSQLSEICTAALIHT